MVLKKKAQDQLLCSNSKNLHYSTYYLFHLLPLGLSYLHLPWSQTASSVTPMPCMPCLAAPYSMPFVQCSHYLSSAYVQTISNFVFPDKKTIAKETREGFFWRNSWNYGWLIFSNVNNVLIGLPLLHLLPLILLATVRGAVTVFIRTNTILFFFSFCYFFQSVMKPIK